MKSPGHIAIIMDGNGRWAKQRGKPRTFGHVKGTRVAKKVITECSRLGVKWLTLYAFSAENWLRPQTEVSLLMRILKRYLERETQNLVKENIRLTVIGEPERLTADLRKALENSVAATSKCTGLNLVFALSYGSRQEITEAARRIAADVKAGRLNPDDITESDIQSKLWTGAAPDPDFVIRTSGEQRLSNFLLWQSAYAEFYFTEILWPDFSLTHLHDAIHNYQTRSRRFGRVEASDELLSETSH
ncbi:MAG TPA: isoprenyl transferase [Pseudobdellovibrionaceae bacterium]|nr:isoprenyl transferase [Pseudobdellovibrionaceae bacterium]